MSIFHNNVELCENISDSLISHIICLIEHKQHDATFLEFLQTIVSSCEKEIDGCQIKIVEEV